MLYSITEQSTFFLLYVSFTVLAVLPFRNALTSSSPIDSEPVAGELSCDGSNRREI